MGILYNFSRLIRSFSAFFVGLAFLGFLVGCGVKKTENAKVAADPNSTPAVIYGQNDLEKVSNERDWKGEFSASFILKHRLLPDTDQNSERGLRAQTVGESLNLCAGEPLAEELQLSDCSGIFISKDLVLTAGHCVKTQEDCDYFKVHRGQREIRKGAESFSISGEEIYQCQELVYQSREMDFSIVRLDREAPLPQKPRLVIANVFAKDVLESPLTLYSFPLGASLHKTEGKVRQLWKMLVADFDSFQGSSGGAVFNSKDQLVGILLKGEQDFEENRGQSCRRILKCAEGECSGETVLPLSSVLKELSQDPEAKDLMSEISEKSFLQ